MKYRILTALVVLVMIALTSLLLFSCSSTKKSVSSVSNQTHVVAEVKTDSTGVKNTDSAHVKKDSIALSVRKDSSFENKVIVEEEFQYLDTAMKLIKRKTTTIQKGKKIFHTSLSSVAYDSSKHQVAESTAVKTHTAIDSTAKSKAYDKHVVRTGISWWWWLLLILTAHLGLNLFIPGYYKKIFKLFS